MYIILNGCVAIVVPCIDKTKWDGCHSYTMQCDGIKFPNVLITTLPWLFYVTVRAAKVVPDGINKNFTLIKILMYAKSG